MVSELSGIARPAIEVRMLRESEDHMMHLCILSLGLERIRNNGGGI